MCLTYGQRRPRADQRRRGRVLRFLPTNLSAPEIADQLSLSVHTVRTHMRNVYAKLGAHGRTRPSSRPAPTACSHAHSAGRDGKRPPLMSRAFPAGRPGRP